MMTSSELDLLIADTESEMERVIAAAEDPQTTELYAWIRFHLGLDRDASRGKRLRPLLGLLAYQSIAGEHQRALPGAAAVEMGHNFSLVHDDIQDGSPERRHRPALWATTGIPQAINTGDTLFTLSRMALHRLTSLGFPDHTVLALMRLYDETCLALCEGQYLDIRASEGGAPMSVEGYLDMIGRKTAALIAGSVQAGAMLATEDAAIIEAYRSFGWALGMAFQINDDLLGIWGDEGATGKRASDLEAHKRTLPILHALEHAPEADRARLVTILETRDVSPAAADQARAIMERAGSRTFTQGRAAAWRDEAISQLERSGIVDGEAMQRLDSIVRSVIAA
ncbi:MAG: polyprenyl synthetase family protein [Chloroflexi bacterium]|nr:polyprenyl synthetase family protein [Chloroflexota bacterium]